MKGIRPERLQVQIYDDHSHLRNMLSFLLENTPGYELAGAFENTATVEDNIDIYKPDVILMDIDMPEYDGISGVKRIRKIDNDLLIIMWSVFEDDHHLFEALCAGANGYLVKGTPPAEILKAIDEVYAGGAPMSPGIARKVTSLFAMFREKPNEEHSLSDREKQILALLVNGYSYKMIAGELNISWETVKTHLKNVYDKLHVHSRTEAVAKAIREKIV